jgi:hypothetical protein
VNRLSFWMRVSGTTVIKNRGSGRMTASVGTYTKVPDAARANQGDHFYHFLYPNWYPNQWMLVTINRVPQHMVSQSGGINWPENPTRWTGRPNRNGVDWDYFDGLTRFYIEEEYPDFSAWGGREYEFADFQFATITGEPDTLVASVTATYTGSGYELSWQGPKNKTQQYTVYTAPVSMHARGLGAGTKSTTTVATTGDDYGGVLWASPAMAQPREGMYFAILPSGQANFTEIYLPDGPYRNKAASQTSLRPPSNLHVVP